MIVYVFLDDIIQELVWIKVRAIGRKKKTSIWSE
jgi:hypothetical protein